MAKKHVSVKRNGRALWLVGAMAVVATSILIIVLSGGKKEQASALLTKSDQEVSAERTLKGSPSAKVKLIEYGDFL